MGFSTVLTMPRNMQSDSMVALALSSATKLILAADPRGWNWGWHTIVYLFLTWQTATVFWKYWWKAPSNIIIHAYPTPFGRWLTALHMIVDSTALVERAYKLSNGKTFAIPMTDRWIVFMSDTEKLKRLENVPVSVLSAELALHELASTAPILGHHQVPQTHDGPRSEAFRVKIGVMKNKLRSRIPSMSKSFHTRVKRELELEFAPSSDDKFGENEWKPIRVMPALLRIFTRINLAIFVGEKQADSPEVYGDVMNFLWSCARAFPIVELMPGPFLPLVTPIVTGWGMARTKVFDRFQQLISQYLMSGESSEEKKGSEDIVHWAVEITKLREAAEIAKITLGLLFASAFQVPMVAQFCIHRLCKHPEYIPQLELEAQECEDITFGSMNRELPHFDSFIKETARLSPGLIVSAPRTVMTTYTTEDGCRIPAGNWIAVPQIAIMCDEKVWPEAKEFKPFRFVDGRGDSSETRFTHPSYEFPFWGAIKHACPARFYVSVILKMILLHLIVEYEFSLEDPTAQPFISFGKARLPSPFMLLLVRRRNPRTEENSNLRA